MYYILCLFGLINLYSFCSNRINETSNEIKQIVIKAFRLAFEKNYDSLSLIMPKHYFEETSKDFQSIAFSELYRAVELGDSPNESNLKTFKEMIHGYPGFVVTYYPNMSLYNNDSLMLFKIDSIRFFFMEPIGYEQISSFKSFAPVPKLKPVIPVGSKLSDSTVLKN
jgi:hypothetical protein